MANKRKTLTKLDSANKNNRFGCSMRHFSVCHRRQRTKFFFQPVVWRLTAYKIEWITHKEYTHFPIASLFLCVYFFIFEGPFYVLFIRSAYIWCEWNTKTNSIYSYSHQFFCPNYFNLVIFFDKIIFRNLIFNRQNIVQKSNWLPKEGNRWVIGTLCLYALHDREKLCD